MNAVNGGDSGQVQLTSASRRLRPTPITYAAEPSRRPKGSNGDAIAMWSWPWCGFIPATLH